jgi:chromosome segregation ATPase
MAEKNVRVPEFLREPLEAAQSRLETLEDETQRLLKELVQKGKAGRREIGELVHKLSKQDWNVDHVRARVEKGLGKLRAQGMELASEWTDRARTEAVERLAELQQRAIAFLGVATREQVEELSKELERLSRKLEKGKRARRPVRRGGAEVSP